MLHKDIEMIVYITRHQFLVTSAVCTALILLWEFYVDHSSDKGVWRNGLFTVQLHWTTIFAR